MRGDLTRTAIGLPVLIFALSVAAFWPAADAEFLNWDDGMVVTQNYAFRGLDAGKLRWMASTSWAGHYQPLTWMSLAADFERFGLEPPDAPDAAGYHRTSIGLHAAGAVAFYFVALEVLSLASAGRPPRRRLAVPAAFAALVFAIHPLRCESVCWITERRDVLSGLFFTLTALAYLRGAPRGAPGAPRPNAIALAAAAGVAALALFELSVSLDDPQRAGWAGPGAAGLALAGAFFGVCVGASLRASGGRTGWLLACHAFLLLSLLAKAWGIVMPAVLLALDAFPLRRWLRVPDATEAGHSGVAAKALLRVGLEKIPFLVLALAFARLAHWAQTAQQGRIDVWAQHTLGERLVQALYGVAYYPVKTLLPFGLVPIHEIPRELGLLEPRFLGAALLVLGVTAALALLARRRPAPLVAWLAYVAIVSPVLGLLQSGPQLVADRYSYLACMPFALLAGAALLAALRRSGAPARAAVALAAALVLGLGALTWRQSRVWRSSERLWSHAYAHAPQTALAALNLALVRMDQARSAPEPTERAAHRDEAERLLAQAAGLGRLEDLVRINRAVLYVQRAQERDGQARAALLARAAALADEALASTEAKGIRDALFHLHAGRVFQQTGRLEAAVDQQRRAVELRPDWPQARLALADALLVSGVQQGETRPAAKLAWAGAAIEQLEVARSLGADPPALAFLLASARDLEWQLLGALGREADAERARVGALGAYASVPPGNPAHPRARERAAALEAAAPAGPP